MQHGLAQSFDSAPRLLGRSARVFVRNLPFLAAVSLAVFIPGKLLFQLAGYLLDIAPEGIASYLLMDFSDLVLGSLTIPAAIYGLTAQKGVGASLRRGRKLWARMFWTRLKVEITVALWALLLFVPGLVAMVKLAVTEPIVVLEPDEPEPLSRSRELTEGRRWRVFWVALPLVLLDFGGSFVVLSALPGVAHSRWLLALSDSVMAVVGMWTTVAGLMMYLGLTDAGRTATSPPRKRS
jgi:hypothetical protein